MGIVPSLTFLNFEVSFEDAAAHFMGVKNTLGGLRYGGTFTSDKPPATKRNVTTASVHMWTDFTLVFLVVYFKASSKQHLYVTWTF